MEISLFEFLVVLLLFVNVIVAARVLITVLDIQDENLQYYELIKISLKDIKDCVYFLEKTELAKKYKESKNLLEDE